MFTLTKLLSLKDSFAHCKFVFNLNVAAGFECQTSDACEQELPMHLQPFQSCAVPRSAPVVTWYLSALSACPLFCSCRLAFTLSACPSFRFCADVAAGCQPVSRSISVPTWRLSFLLASPSFLSCADVAPVSRSSPLLK